MDRLVQSFLCGYDSLRSCAAGKPGVECAVAIPAGADCRGQPLQASRQPLPTRMLPGLKQLSSGFTHIAIQLCLFSLRETLHHGLHITSLARVCEAGDHIPLGNPAHRSDDMQVQMVNADVRRDVEF